MVTSRDVARLAGVSQATVSRALSASSKLSPATREKVLAAMTELDYVPHAGAQAMKTRRTNVVGVVLDDLANPVYPQLLDEITRLLDRRGYRVVIWNARGDGNLDALHAIAENAVDGVIFTTATPSSPELQAAIERHRPLVLLSRDVDGVDCDKVVADNYAGGAAVADFVVAHGRTDVAMISGVGDSTTSRDRGRGFLDRMAAHGHALPERRRLVGAYSHDLAAQITDRLMGEADRPGAIFCLNDNMAFGALNTLRRRAITAEECWVIGYDDVDMAGWASFDLTTVHHPTRDMAAEAARLLLERITDLDSPPRVARFGVSLIERGSTPLPAAAG